MTRRTKIEEPQQRGRRKQTDDDCADDAAGDDDHADADFFSTVIQLHFRTLVQRRIVCNSVIAVIAHSFLLNSVAQPVGRDHA